MADDVEESPLPLADLLISLALVLTTCLAYIRVFAFSFVPYDDLSYVYNNLHLRQPLSFNTLKWIFFSYDPDNWFPLTRFSLLLDYKLVGPAAGFYHAENVIIHCMAAVLLFGFLRQATQARWPSAFVAAIFALHPLHVESVAWIAERKDVLCAFFWFATLWAWTANRRYLAFFLFLFGLMSKPMIVTLPFLLVLLDVWPLRRRITIRITIMDKLPFFVASGAVMAITILAQHNAIAPLDEFPLPLRVENALVTPVIYVADMLWPAHLWAPYAYPRTIPLWQVLLASAAIVATSVGAFLQIRQRPYLTVGWCWFLVTLVPVIGLVQVGVAARADRYMYVPMVGLAIAIAWSLAGRLVWRALAIAVCFAMAVRTFAQTEYWSNAQTLFGHASGMDRGNYLAQNYFCASLTDKGESLDCFRRALRIRPESAELHNNLAGALCATNHCDEGIVEYRESIRMNPSRAQTHINLGQSLLRTGHAQEASGEFETALRLDPKSAAAHNDLGALLLSIPGRDAEGLHHLERAIELDPEDAAAQSNLGQALVNRQRFDEAIPHFGEALRINPDLRSAYLGLAEICLRKGLQPGCVL